MVTRNPNNTLKDMRETIVITGGMGLLGGALTDYLTDVGYHVIVVDVLDKTEIAVDCDYVQFDLMDINNYHILKTLIKEKTNNLKILINNAAYNPKIEGKVGSFGRFEDEKVGNLEKEIKLNLEAPIFLTQILLDVFNTNSNKNCKIINVVSTYGLVPPNQNLYKELSKIEGKEIVKPIGYSVTKAGLIMATKYLAVYLGDKGFNVNGVAPGGIENGQNQVFIDEYSRMTPMNRMGKVEEMLGIFELLCGEKSDYISGQIIAVDGGFTVW